MLTTYKFLHVFHMTVFEKFTELGSIYFTDSQHTTTYRSYIFQQIKIWVVSASENRTCDSFVKSCCIVICCSSIHEISDRNIWLQKILARYYAKVQLLVAVMSGEVKQSGFTDSTLSKAGVGPKADTDIFTAIWKSSKKCKSNPAKSKKFDQRNEWMRKNILQNPWTLGIHPHTTMCDCLMVQMLVRPWMIMKFTTWTTAPRIEDSAMQITKGAMTSA